MNDLKKKFFEENFQTENELIVLDRKMESVAGHIEVEDYMQKNALTIYEHQRASNNRKTIHRRLGK